MVKETIRNRVMEQFRISMYGHIRIVVIEFLVILLCSIYYFFDFIFSKGSNDSLFLYIIGYVVWTIAYFTASVYYRRWVFPMSLTIKDDLIEVDCMFLFLFRRHYLWRKEDVRVIYKQFMGFDICNISILNIKTHDRVLFESIAVKKKLIHHILSALKMSGYIIEIK